MGDEDFEVGPIDYVIVEWPPGTQPTGEALPILLDLVDRGLIRVLDLAFVHKNADGTVTALDVQDFDLDASPELIGFVGAASGLLGQDDFDEAGAAVEPERSAAILLYENTWAAPFGAAVRRSGAQLVATGRVPVNAIIAALDQLETADA